MSVIEVAKKTNQAGVKPGLILAGPELYIVRPDSYWPYVFFDPDEMRCRHCGELVVSVRLMDALEALRGSVGRPLTVVSGYRCQEHNKAVGGAAKSLHLDGMAADIRAVTPLARVELIHQAGQFGLNGVGVYRTFVHLDIGRRRYWTDYD